MNKIKLIGIALSVIGTALGLVADCLKDKAEENEMRDEVRNCVKAELNK